MLQNNSSIDFNNEQGYTDYNEQRRTTLNICIFPYTLNAECYVAY